MPVLNVVDAVGTHHALETAEGWRLMEIMRDWGVEIGCECGGAASCGQCRIEVAAEWLNRLPPRTLDEEAKLDELADVSQTTRLACQILWSDALDGLRVSIPSVSAEIVSEAA